MRRPAMSTTGTVAAVNAQHHGGAAGGRLQLDEIAGAEIMHRDDLAELVAVRRERHEADQVGVIELVVRRCRKAVSPT